MKIKHSEKSKQKIREARKRQLISPESYRKAVETRKRTTSKQGYYHSKEARKKIGDKNKISLKGHKLSKDSIEKRYKTRIENGWYKNRGHTINKISGKNSKMWLGGEREKEYEGRFTKCLKEKIVKRDNYTCQICGILLEGNIHPHHIDYEKKNSNEDNLITLCNSCHSKTNYNRRSWLDLICCFISHRNSRYNEVWECINKPIEGIIQ